MDATDDNSLSLAAIAEQIARKAHKGQTRRDGRTPYIVHPADVAARVTTDVEKAVAWLHDVLEDTALTADDLLAQHVPQDVVDAVQALTRNKDESYTDFIQRVKPNTLAARVKRADIASNLADAPTEHQREKYAAALAVLDEKD